MRAFGAILKDERSRRGYSLADLETNTKIKQVYLVALENNDWEKLPEYPIVLGFVKLISHFLGDKQNNLVSLLRRDYSPRFSKEKTSPPREVFLKSLSPKVIGFVLVVLFLFLGGVYLVFQYVNFNRNPTLILDTPKETVTVKRGTKMEIVGKTDTDVTVFLNNQPLYVDDRGIFKGEYIALEKTTLLLSAISRAGKKTEITREILVE